jgi:hypothetical protein
MNSRTPDRFEIGKYLKPQSSLLVIAYIYISLLGLLYTIFYNSGSGFNLFKYYELTDFLLIGVINYKVLLFAISTMIIAYILMDEFEIYFIRRFRTVGYGERFFSDDEKALIRGTLRSNELPRCKQTGYRYPD